MIFFDKTRTIGQDANGKNVVWVSIHVDSAADLPAYNDYQSDGFILCMSSEGRCIDTGDLYRLDSAGAWQISQAGTGTYTKAEIDTLLNAKQDVLTFDSTPTQDSTNPVTSGGIWTDQHRQDMLQDEDRAELIELVDGGAKNKFTKPSDSVSSTGSWSETSGLTDITAGIQYVMSFENLDSSDTDSTTIQIRFSNPDLSYELYRQCQRGQNVSVSFSPQQNITNVRVYKADSYAHGDGDTMSFSGAMICTAAAWKISQSFQPYRPSWQEMYDMIQALQ